MIATNAKIQGNRKRKKEQPKEATVLIPYIDLAVPPPPQPRQPGQVWVSGRSPWLSSGSLAKEQNGSSASTRDIKPKSTTPTCFRVSRRESPNQFKVQKGPSCLTSSNQAAVSQSDRRAAKVTEESVNTASEMSVVSEEDGLVGPDPLLM